MKLAKQSIIVIAVQIFLDEIIDTAGQILTKIYSFFIW